MRKLGFPKQDEIKDSKYDRLLVSLYNNINSHVRLRPSDGFHQNIDR